MCSCPVVSEGHCFLTLFKKISESWKGGSTVNMPYMEMSILQAFILYTLASCWSL